MKNILQIIKKELLRFFKDRRLLISILLPGVLIYVLYSVIGDTMQSFNKIDDDYNTKVSYVGDLPAKFIRDLEIIEFEVSFTLIEKEEIGAAKKMVQEKEIDILLIFPESFDLTAPNGDIEIYYNATKKESENAFTNFYALFDTYSCTRSFYINNDGSSDYNLASDKDTVGMMVSMLLPFLIVTFLFSGCMAVTPESIAGEKERGTIATLLVTPIKRSELAIGKIVSLSIIALVSALSSAIGVICSLPKMMSMQGSINMEYTVGDYVAVFLVIMCAVLLIVSVMAVISTFAKSVKEANTLVMPLMIVMMLVGITSMLGLSANEYYYYLIPLFNVTQVLSNIFAFKLDAIQILITVSSTIIYTLIFVFILVKMFNNEKIIFNK